MNNEQQQIIDEVYENYNSIFTKKYNGENLKLNQYPLSEDVIHRLILSQEEFINRIKTDKEFSERWGLKIEERELTWDERHELAETKYQIDDVDDVLDENDIPTKVITITYNDKTIETYE
jgi:hypothetical protein